MRLKASIPLLYANSDEIYSIRHLNAFTAGSVHLKEAFRRPEGPYRSPMPWGLLVKLIHKFRRSYCLKQNGYFFLKPKTVRTADSFSEDQRTRHWQIECD